VPVPLIEYGFGYARDNRSPALANLLATIADVAPPLARELPEGRELVFNRENAEDSAAI
jgi:hypothetical protein